MSSISTSRPSGNVAARVLLIRPSHKNYVSRTNFDPIRLRHSPLRPRQKTYRCRRRPSAGLTGGTVESRMA